MKGTLHKTKHGWTVKYGSYINLKSLPLHPSDESVVSQTYINDEYETIYIYVGKEVEFEIAKEYIDSHTNQVQTYAKLTPKIDQTNGERFDEFMKTVEYPELEGTNALCEDVIKKRTGKMTEEEWQAAERGEISDEEIEQAAKEYDIKSTRWGAKTIFIDAIKWYKEQLKNK